MGITVAETIKNITSKHINQNGLVLGQCLTAVGWVGGTIPEFPHHPNIVELSMADSAGGSIATGAALTGRRPIYVVRYQGFLWYNLVSIVNYAAKSKELWDVDCPLFLRAIAMEGGIGPVAGSSHYSLAYKMPGIRIVCPMTPGEYETVWDEFLEDSIPYFVSEHRGSYKVDYETPPVIHEEADITVFCISITRFNALEAIKILEDEGYRINFVPIVDLKPLTDIWSYRNYLRNSKCGGLLLDDDYTDGVAKSISYDIMKGVGKQVYTLGLKDKSAGFHKEEDNLPPSTEEILQTAKDILCFP